VAAIDLTDQLAALWESSPVTPTVIAMPKLAPLPEPFGCEFDHGDSANWKLGTDRYGRKGWRRVTCKGCGEFYGYRQSED
jgi:hypothetical protein